MELAVLDVFRHRRFFEDHRAMAAGGFGKAGHIAAHMHHCAFLREHGAIKGRADFRLEISSRQESRIGIDLGVQRVEIPCQTFEMLRLGSELQLAGAAEIAINPLLCDQCFQRVD
ncbi:hypothetical protein D3C80_586270 [compost metagenome]